ncbi:Stage II sporulation protein E (SpoIIE) [Singulisphaera sp. GP187]|uniref:PP2C family protein-serine/threonine phosphatase n=1 Tax=Singulisphaera sp. GP187 TaxID=1882752 RepID=UPI0009272EC9|nr:PP2C family protein-serine/threonine phosphatase [Singulisphaera sp. GP187]SIO18875.1 Stage II sporulation protein E (SpoIIE) [Singulisphaera sp. GP187]
MPTITGFDIAGWNQQAEATGGDFFEFQEVSRGCLAVTVADVCGRGAGAAAVADECRAAVHEAFESIGEPARVAERVNRRLFAGRPPERFVTAFFGLLDLNAHQLNYISAGHGPTWFYSSALNSLRELEVHGYPLALMIEESFDVAGMTQFAPGDFVAIVTDGFFEWLDLQGECFGTQRLCAQILRDRDRSAAEIISGLRTALLSFANGVPQRDDLTAVVIKRVS